MIFSFSPRKLHAMSFFQRPHYTSDATNFLNDLKASRPHLDAAQQEGRALLWDKEIDTDLQADMRAGRVQQSSYVYYPMGSIHARMASEMTAKKHK